MYQTSIRNKKKSSNFNKVANNNYAIDKDYEVFAYVMKVLGNCRVLVLCDNGTETIGVIRGSMRRFNKRVLIETGDIVAVSMRDFQINKVDIVHKYNAEQCKLLIANKEISDTLINAYNKVSSMACNNANDADILFDDTQGEQGENKEKAKNSKDTYHDAIFVFNSEDEDCEDGEDCEDDGI
uniref:S1-like domain-containing protein n=1 Tax=viral metagenome TaxID=1070528 RepID=A0A6C0LII2_9ZZZZ